MDNKNPLKLFSKLEGEHDQSLSRKILNLAGKSTLSVLLPGENLSVNAVYTASAAYLAYTAPAWPVRDEYNWNHQQLAECFQKISELILSQGYQHGTLIDHWGNERVNPSSSEIWRNELVTVTATAYSTSQQEWLHSQLELGVIFAVNPQGIPYIGIPRRIINNIPR